MYKNCCGKNRHNAVKIEADESFILDGFATANMAFVDGEWIYMLTPAKQWNSFLTFDYFAEGIGFNKYVRTRFADDTPEITDDMTDQMKNQIKEETVNPTSHILVECKDTYRSRLPINMQSRVVFLPNNQA